VTQILLPKNRLAAFVGFLSAGHKLIGPVRLGQGQFKFSEVRTLAEMSLHHLPKGGYDLLFTELDDGYFVHINTQQGETLTTESGLFEPASDRAQHELETLWKKKKNRFNREIPIDYQDLRLFKETFDSTVWDEVGECCLAGGNCTNVCPTCYCFDVLDETDLDLTRGRRIRVGDSCQDEGFAMVAGGESFHRKFNYPMTRYGRMFCPGCGRCSRTRMAAIDLPETIKALIEERR